MFCLEPTVFQAGFFINTTVSYIEKLEKKSSFSNDVGFTEAEEVDTGVVLDNVFYITDEAKTSMIVDGGCPSTLSGKEILNRYLKENNINYDDLPTKMFKWYSSLEKQSC